MATKTEFGTAALESCAWSLTYQAYGQAGCSGGFIGDYPSHECTPGNAGETQGFSGCAQFIDWTQEYTCVCE